MSYNLVIVNESQAFISHSKQATPLMYFWKFAWNSLGMSLDIRKSGYRISSPISGYENSQTISENNK